MKKRNYKAEYQRRKDLALMRKFSRDQMYERCKSITLGLPKPTKAVTPPREADPLGDEAGIEKAVTHLWNFERHGSTDREDSI